MSHHTRTLKEPTLQNTISTIDYHTTLFTPLTLPPILTRKDGSPYTCGNNVLPCGASYPPSSALCDRKGKWKVCKALRSGPHGSYFFYIGCKAVRGLIAEKSKGGMEASQGQKHIYCGGVNVDVVEGWVGCDAAIASLRT